MYRLLLFVVILPIVFVLTTSSLLFLAPVKRAPWELRTSTQQLVLLRAATNEEEREQEQEQEQVLPSPSLMDFLVQNDHDHLAKNKKKKEKTNTTSKSSVRSSNSIISSRRDMISRTGVTTSSLFFSSLLSSKSQEEYGKEEQKHSINSSTSLLKRTQQSVIGVQPANAVELASSSPSTTATYSTSFSTNEDNLRKNYLYRNDWKGSNLTIISPIEAADNTNTQLSSSTTTYPMGRWPDPILRRSANLVDPLLMGTKELRSIAYKLKQTAIENEAVGLAAQQCGIDASLVFLDITNNQNDYKTEDGTGSSGLLFSRFFSKKQGEGTSSSNNNNNKEEFEDGLFLVNPRIISRSSEMEMKVWNEVCLVLPPTFTATVLRDSKIIVQYEDLDGNTKNIHLSGELARAAQHEMDHDRGILIVDHVSLEELENEDMIKFEREGHDERMAMAYSRSVFEPLSNSLIVRQEEQHQQNNSVRRSFFVPNARAAELTTGATTQQSSQSTSQDEKEERPACDEDCLARRKQIIQERRAMMQQSRSSTKRQDVLDLSRQRAKLYDSTFQGVTCPPNIPCI